MFTLDNKVVFERITCLKWPAITLLVFLGSMLLAIVFPVYFRSDDGGGVDWVRTLSLADALNPFAARGYDMIRPMPDVVVWLLFRIGHYDPFPYQVALGWFFGMAVVFYWCALRCLNGIKIATLSVMALLLVFYYLLYVLFWFGDFVYAVELFFAFWTLWCFVLGLRESPRYWIWVPILYACCVFSKEPLTGVLPMVCAGIIFKRWELLEKSQRLWGTVLVASLAISGAIWLLFGSNLRGRQLAAAAGAPDVLWHAYVTRWEFYAQVLMSNLGVLIWVAVFYLALKTIFSRKGYLTSSNWWLLPSASIIGAFICRLNPAWGLLVLFAACIPLLFRRDDSVIGACWFGALVAGVLTISYVVRTYLVEAAFGMAWVMGIAAADQWDMLRARMTKLVGRRGRGRLWLGLIILIGLTGIAVFSSARIVDKYRVLRVVVECRSNFRSAVEYIIKFLPADAQLVMVSSKEDMGMSQEKDILPLPDAEKALRQSTMEYHQLARFLKGTRPIPVHGLGWMMQTKHSGSIYVLTCNQWQDNFLKQQPVEMELVKEWGTPDSRVKTRIYRVVPIK